MYYIVLSDHLDIIMVIETACRIAYAVPRTPTGIVRTIDIGLSIPNSRLEA
jgi:hypothetical protein